MIEAGLASLLTTSAILGFSLLLALFTDNPLFGTDVTFAKTFGFFVTLFTIVSEIMWLVYFFLRKCFWAWGG